MKRLPLIVLLLTFSIGSSIRSRAADAVFDWKIGQGTSSSETLRASFLGTSRGQVYLLHEKFPIGKSYPVESLDAETQERVAVLSKQVGKAFVFDADALKGKWSLTPAEAAVSRGTEYRAIPLGHFDILGIRIGMTDREVVEVLSKLGADILPIEPVHAFETRWMIDFKRVEVPRAEQKYVTAEVNGLAYRDASGNPVTDWARIKKRDYSETRSFRIKFAEDVGTKPSRAIAVSLQMGVTLAPGSDAARITDLLTKTAASKYGSPKSPRYWEFSHPGVRNGTESLAVNDVFVQVETQFVGLLIQENSEKLIARLKKEAGAATQSLGF